MKETTLIQTPQFYCADHETPPSNNRVGKEYIIPLFSKPISNVLMYIKNFACVE